MNKRVSVPVARRRPAVVTAAGSTLAAGGLLFAGEVLLSGNAYFTGMATYEQAVHDNVVKNDTAFAAFGVLVHSVMTVVGVFVGAILVVMAMLIFVGRPWARVVSWIFGIPVLLWYGGLVASMAVSGLLAGDVQSSDSAELTSRLDEAWPAFWYTLDYVLMAAVAALLITALVFQTVPAADAYFRSRRG